MSSKDKQKDVVSPEPNPQKGITRKNFLRGSAFAMLGAAATAASGGVAFGATKEESKGKTSAATKTHSGKTDRSYITHETDVLIIGGGIAGMAAARQAVKAGLNVSMIDKGPAGHSGGSGMAWGHTFVTNEFYEGDVKNSVMAFLVDCSGIIDQENYLALCKATKEGRPIAFAEQCGTVQQRNEKGNVAHMDDGGPITFVYEYRSRHEAQHIIHSGVRVFDNTMVVDILRAPDGSVAGCVGINLYTGEAHVFRAKTVVMATGGYVWNTGYTINGPELTGEGHAIFMRHGLAMKDMEFFHADLEAFRPYGSRMKARNELEPAMAAALNGESWDVLYNKRGENVAKGFFLDPKLSAYPGAAFLGAIITSAKEIMHGDGTPGDGSGNGIMMDVTRWYNDTNLGDTLYGHRLREAETALGYKHDKRVECIPEFYGSCAQPKINPHTTETEIPGLFCAVHNLTELTSMISFAQGHLAGKYAAEKAANIKMPAVSVAAIQDILNRNYGLLENTPSNPIRVTEVFQKIQDTFYKGLSLIRDEKGMTAALNEFLRIQKEDLPRINVPYKTKQFNRDWRNAMEVESMLLCSIGTAYGSLYRKETRPFHFRSDYPVMDNDNWLANVWVKMQKEGPWTVTKTPIVDTVFPAEQVKKVLLPVDMRVPNVHV